MADDEMGARIIQAYEDAGLNRNQFALKLGTTYPNVMRWEKGETKPKGDYLSKISELTGVTVAWLLNGPPAPKYLDEERLERDADEDLPASELAIRLLRPMDPEVEDELRAHIQGVHFSTGADVSPIMWELEQKKRQILAERRGQTSDPGDASQGPDPSKVRADRTKRS